MIKPENILLLISFMAAGTGHEGKGAIIDYEDTKWT